MRLLRDDLPLTLSFFSRFPVGGGRHGRRLADAVWVLPLASALLALPAAVALAVASWAGVGALAAALIAVAVLALSTGALHEDGFADCADGFFGAATAERRLEIMADSRVGTYGAYALILATGLKAALLAALLTSVGVLATAAVFVASAVAARTVALYPWVAMPAARQGLAASMGRPTSGTFRVAGALAVAIVALAMSVAGLGAAVVGIVAAIIAAIALAGLAERLIGGHTGDVIGATVIACDLAYLVAATMWLT